MPSLTQDPRFGSQADQQTDKESNPHGYNSIGTKYVDYGLGANPNPAREGLFRKEEFHYDAQNDVFICPGNQQLHPRYRSTGGEPDQPWNSDEPQHLHVVWAWANGMLPYKDVFDNHSPLFQAISAPLFALLGERADIVKAMRWTMVPIAGLILAMTYLTGVRLFSPRVGLWGALLTATFPGFYFETGEYRPDVLWTALWLITLAILTAGKPHPRRLFAAGLTFGIAFAVSMKTTFLALTLLTASVAVWLLRFAVPGSRSSPKMSGYHVIASFLAPVAGALIVPLIVVAFFAWNGALKQMY